VHSEKLGLLNDGSQGETVESMERYWEGEIGRGGERKEDDWKNSRDWISFSFHS
jgi:hypothetical protein